MALGVASFLFLAQRFLGDIGREPSAKVAAQAKANGGAAEEDKPLTGEETDRIKVILILALFVVFFWAAFEQAGGLMNLYTDEKVDRVVFGWTVPTTWFQAVNPVFILGLGPLFSMLWTRLGEKGKDPPIPVKMGIGLLLLSLGFVFMLGASAQSAAQGKAALYWVILAYFFHTTGELCLSPIGLSMVTKLAPKKYASLLMGCWFLSNAIANKLAGTIGTYADKLGEFKLFAVIVGVTGVCGLVLISVAGPLRRMMHGADAIKRDTPKVTAPEPAHDGAASGSKAPAEPTDAA
jgi:POT family proton-dependent oligopeptide transporter